jgi:hypothetical protein
MCPLPRERNVFSLVYSKLAELACTSTRKVLKPDSVSLPTYGTDAIGELTAHYGEDKDAETMHGEETVKKAMVSSDLFTEWVTFLKLLVREINSSLLDSPEHLCSRAGRCLASCRGEIAQEDSVCCPPLLFCQGLMGSSYACVIRCKYHLVWQTPTPCVNFAFPMPVLLSGKHFCLANTDFMCQFCSAGSSSVLPVVYGCPLLLQLSRF